MRILQPRQMLREPVGTVFSVEQFGSIADLFIKTGNTPDGRGITHTTLIAPRKDPEATEALENLEEAMIDSDFVIELDFDATFEFCREFEFRRQDEIHFILYSREEINEMITRLTRAHEALAAGKRMIPVGGDD